jgi:hypothetical protein
MSLLRRLVDGFNDRSDSSLVADVFSVVAVEEAHSLLRLALAGPVLNQVSDFGDVEELNVVDVSVDLPLQDHRGGQTCVTHGSGPGGVVLAVSLDLVRDGGGRETVVALGLWGMLSLALDHGLVEEIVK